MYLRGYVKYAVKYVYVDLPAFLNTQCKFTKESSLNCHKKSFFFKFSFLNLFISIQATGQTFKLTVICIGASLTFVGTAASDSSTFFVRVQPNSC